MRFQTRTEFVQLKTYKWMCKYHNRKRCYFCVKRNRVVFRCASCRKSLCIKHSILICKNFNKYNRKKWKTKFCWKVKNNQRLRCRRCHCRDKVPYRCSDCGIGVCLKHSILLCNICKNNYELLKKL